MADHAQLPPEKGEWLMNSVVSAAGLGNLPANAPADGAFSFTDGGEQTIHVRVSLVPSIRGRSLVMRFLHPWKMEGLQLEKLGFHHRQAEETRKAFSQPDGLWLVAGPTGSGKTTTLYSLLCLSVAWHEKVLTAEDPVEMVIPGLQQAQVDESAGRGFANLLRGFMRQAPDTLLIGEIRDEETATITMQAANSGHRVLGSIHASGNAGILRRFSDLGQSPGIVSASCTAVIHQRLVNLVCRECCSSRKTPETLRQSSAGLPGCFPEDLAVARGCPLCVGGYAGQTGVYDLQMNLGKDLSKDGLLRSGWPLLIRKQTTPECLLPYFPRAVRRKFTLCHV
jgi:type II secretory ATPase GspE/PulE/Tfp pilus assembly ATPase PilB-like protein